MLKIAVCDDENIFRNELEEMIRSYFVGKDYVCKIVLFESGVELLKELKKEEYNILFLDINMDKVTGIDVAKEIRKENKNIFIVFVTAFLDYSLEGYKVDAIRYLLKDDKRMQDTINECMDAILGEINRKLLKIRLNFIEKTKFIALDDIIYIESSLHKLYFYIYNTGSVKCYTLYNTLNEIEKRLPEKQFVRTHQSYLINAEYIDNIKNYRVTLIDGVSLPIAKTRYKDVRRVFLMYKGSLEHGRTFTKCYNHTN